MSDCGSPIKYRDANDSRQSGNNPPLWKEEEFVEWSERRHWTVMDPTPTSQLVITARRKRVQRGAAMILAILVLFCDGYIDYSQQGLPPRSPVSIAFQIPTRLCDWRTALVSARNPYEHVEPGDIVLHRYVIISGSSSFFPCHDSVRG